MVGSLSRESRAPAVVWVSETWKTHVFTTPLKFNNGTCLRWFFAFYQGKSPFFTTNFRRIGRLTFSKRLMAEIAKNQLWKMAGNHLKMAFLESRRSRTWISNHWLQVKHWWNFGAVQKDLLGSHQWLWIRVVDTKRVSGTTVAGWKQWFKDVCLFCLSTFMFPDTQCIVYLDTFG